MKISIIGTGYVGLVTGACLADRGHLVTCVDLNPDRVNALNSAQPPIFEAGLAEFLRANVPRRLRATTELAAAVQETDLTFICVGTPFDGQTIDLTAVTRAARQIGTALGTKPGYHVVVVKSTVVPGTTEQTVLPLLEETSGRTAGSDFGVGMNPEFLSEGQAVQDFLNPDRIVLGGIDRQTIAWLEEVYRPFPDAPRIHTNPRTAELIKYTSNALLATLVSFSNEIANLAAAIGDIDAMEVMEGLHLSQYFRCRDANGLPPLTSFLQPGCGFGGSCLPKDVKALIAHARGHGSPLRLLQAVIDVNEQQPQRLIRLLEREWPDLAGVRVAVLGLAFKAGTNDVRESPAFPVIRALLRRQARVTAFDPEATADFQHELPDPRIHYSDTIDDALAGAEAVVVVTAWPEFADLPERLRALAPEPLLVDGRRAFEVASVSRYAGIGLSP
jgi:UDPglucose 6-dehydrogenase